MLLLQVLGAFLLLFGSFLVIHAVWKADHIERPAMPNAPSRTREPRYPRAA